MKTYRFNDKEANLEDFFYACSPAAKGRKEFTQLEDCIANFAPGESEREGVFDYDYISMVTKKTYGSGTEFSAKCNFVKFGAPLLVFCSDFITDADGTSIYQLHYEIVAYEDGCNIWRVVPCPERTERPIQSTLIGKLHFKIAPDELIEIKAKVEGKTVYADVNGHAFSCEHPDIPEEFHVGITACEGYNRFFDFKVSE